MLLYSIWQYLSLNYHAVLRVETMAAIQFQWSLKYLRAAVNDVLAR